MTKLRNIIITAHVDSGKTSFTERTLLMTGKKHKIGEVHNGEATMDSMKQERDRGITIASAATTLLWNDYTINLIDSPGHIDFNAGVERSMRVVDGVVLLVDSVAGAQPQTETVWRQAKRYDLPAIAFINKMDRDGADWQNAISSLHRVLGVNAHAVNMPVVREHVFIGIADILTGEAWTYPGDGLTPEALALSEAEQSTVNQMREKLHEALADCDMEFMELFVHHLETGTQITAEQTRSAITRSTRARVFVPVMHGAALKNAGIQPVLDAVCEYLPAPDLGTGENISFAFNVQAMNTQTKNVWARIYSGRLEVGMQITNARTGKTERIGRILRLHADKTTAVDVAFAGDIVALVGLKTVSTGDTLGDKGIKPLEGIVIPEPTVAIALEAKDKQSSEKLAAQLALVLAEDPSLRSRTEQETGQLVLEGVGELQLEVVVQRLEEVGCNLRAGNVMVTYKRKLSQDCLDTVGFVKRQSGGRGQFAKVIVDIMPGETGSGFVFEDKLVGNNVSREWVPHIRRGLEARAATGVDGESVLDVICILKDGAQHAVDSSEYAFREAGSVAMENAIEMGTTRLEPISSVEVSMPETDMGSILGDLQKRRGQILSTETEFGQSKVVARVPQSELLGYTTAVRSMTQGRGMASQTPAGYQAMSMVTS